MLPGIIPPVAGVGILPSFSYRTAINDTVSRSTYTYSATDIGSAAALRYVVVGVCPTGSGPLNATNSVTVGGVSCTKLAEADAGGDNYSALWITNTPITSGTTADIVVTYAGSMNDGAIAVWAVYDILSNAASDTLTDTGTTLSGAIDVPADGILIAAGFGSNGTPTFTWTNITENFEQSTVAGGFSGASILASGTVTVTATPSATDSADTLAVIALR